MILADFLVALGSGAVVWLLLARPALRQSRQLRRASQELSESYAATVRDLKRERDLLGGILETMQEGLLLLNEQDEIVLLNPSLRSTLLLPADVVGKKLSDALQREELNELVRQARGTHKPAASELSVSGLKPRRLAVRANPMPAPSSAVLLVFFDVTEVRRLESMRRDFVANVSHELRTPVTAICSATETLLGGALKDLDAAPMFVQIIERNSERLRALVEDLLDLSRIESKEYKLERTELDISTIVERALSLIREKAQKGRVRIDVELAPDLPVAIADARALEQVLLNLVENAIKYCPPGSRVVVRARVDRAGYVRIAIEDTGPGIPERDLPRLFERFYRVDAGRSREMGGTGLGLSIVKHLVEAMGGEVGVQSRVGFGSTFWFTLPTV
ncbi:MAG TPA: ATP-binding protein [Polyangiaceae bacterium]|nr:ATP-binding protein [Polyangiaceae bacterium]